jgi:anti-sigma regulatory factor (Ser/Thr protein kinase)
LEVAGGDEIVPLVRAWAAATAAALGARPQVASDFALAVSEACTNVVRHAYARAGAPDSRLILSAERDGATIVMRLRDFGCKFDPSRVPVPNLDGEPSIGGYGIYLMRQVMDDVQYVTNHPVGTELILIRRIAD